MLYSNILMCLINRKINTEINKCRSELFYNMAKQFLDTQNNFFKLIYSSPNIL